jgi:hypothetical protein
MAEPVDIGLPAAHKRRTNGHLPVDAAYRAGRPRVPIVHNRREISTRYGQLSTNCDDSVLAGAENRANSVAGRHSE